MPWTCGDCQAEVADDTTSACPGCGKQKTAWTIGDHTRKLVVAPSKKRFELLRGESSAPASSVGDYEAATWVPTDVASAVPKERVRSLLASALLPAPRDVLTVRVLVAGQGRKVKVTILFEADKAQDVELAVPDDGLESSDVRVLPVFGAPGEEVPIVDGVQVLEVSESTELGHAPSLKAAAAGKPARTVRLEAPGIVRVRLTGMLYETDKTFLLPRSLRAIKAFKRIYEKRRPRSVLIVGHTDTMGAPNYNCALSVQRAESMRAYMIDLVDDWAARYTPSGVGLPWGVREDKHMLSHLEDDAEAPFYAGAIDAQPDAGYLDAMARFEAWSNAHQGTALPGNGYGGAATRRALIRAYMNEDETTLPPDTNLVVHGCGEYHPAVATGDNVEEEENRRVEVFMFPDEVEPPAQDPCPDPGCPEYPQWLESTAETIDVRDDLATLEIIVRDEAGQPLADADVTIDGAGIDHGTTGPDGRLVLEDELPGTYKVTVEKQGYPSKTVDAEAPGVVEVELSRTAPSIARTLPGTVFVDETACPGPGAIEHLRWLTINADLAAESRQLRIFAHTREGGGGPGDKDISDRRGRVVLALLTRDLPAFDALAAEEAWGVSCYQAMLRGLGCDPGPIDGVANATTTRAVKGFQRDYGRDAFHHDVGATRAHGDLPVDGALTPETQAAIRDAYVAQASGPAPLRRESFLGEGASGCSAFCSREGQPLDGRVEVTVFVEPPPESFPCKLGDASVCELDRDAAPRCPFYRGILAYDDTQVQQTFFDLSWQLAEDGKTVTLSALTPLADGTPVSFTVHRHEAPLVEPPLTSWSTGERPVPGPTLGSAQGVARGGVVTAAWTPPAGYDPFDWFAWLTDLAKTPDAQRLQPPVFVVESGERWATSRPPGAPLGRLRLGTTGSLGGRALLSDGRMVTFESQDGLMRGLLERAVALQVDSHVVEGVST